MYKMCHDKCDFFSEVRKVVYLRCLRKLRAVQWGARSYSKWLRHRRIVFSGHWWSLRSLVDAQAEFRHDAHQVVENVGLLPLEGCPGLVFQEEIYIDRHTIG